MKLPGLLAGLLFSAAAVAGQVYVASVSHQSGSHLVEQLAKTTPVSHNTTP